MWMLDASRRLSVSGFPLSPISLFTCNGYRPDFFGMTEAEQGLVGGGAGWCNRGGKGMYRDDITVFCVCLFCIFRTWYYLRGGLYGHSNTEQVTSLYVFLLHLLFSSFLIFFNLQTPWARKVRLRERQITVLSAAGAEDPMVRGYVGEFGKPLSPDTISPFRWTRGFLVWSVYSCPHVR